MYFIGLSFAKIFPSLLKKVQVMLKQAPISEASLEWGLSILLKILVASGWGPAENRVSMNVVTPISELEYISIM